MYTVPWVSLVVTFTWFNVYVCLRSIIIRANPSPNICVQILSPPSTCVHVFAFPSTRDIRLDGIAEPTSTVLFRAMFPKIIISPSTICAVDFFVKWKYVLLKPATCMYIYIDLFTFWQVWQQWCKCIIIGIYYWNQYTTNKLFHKWKWDRKSYKSMIKTVPIAIFAYELTVFRRNSGNSRWTEKGNNGYDHRNWKGNFHIFICFIFSGQRKTKINNQKYTATHTNYYIMTRRTNKNKHDENTLMGVWTAHPSILYIILYVLNLIPWLWYML